MFSSCNWSEEDVRLPTAQTGPSFPRHMELLSFCSEEFLLWFKQKPTNTSVYISIHVYADPWGADVIYIKRLEIPSLAPRSSRPRRSPSWWSSWPWRTRWGRRRRRRSTRRWTSPWPWRRPLWGESSWHWYSGWSWSGPWSLLQRDERDTVKPQSYDDSCVYNKCRKKEKYAYVVYQLGGVLQFRPEVANTGPQGPVSRPQGMF